MMWVLLWLGCSDYGFSGKSDGTDDNGDSGGSTTTISTPGVCKTGDYPGYAGSSDASCVVEVETGTFTPVLEWTKPSWGDSSNSIMMTPVVGNLTDDNEDGAINELDTPDIVVITYYPAVLRAIRGDGGGEIFNVEDGAIQYTGAVALGDIDGDGIIEVVVPTSTGIRAYEHDGTFKWDSEHLAGHFNGTSDAPAISDMDGDGFPEVTMGSAILNHDGTTRGLGAYGMAGTTNVGTVSVAADLDVDGTLELITGNAAYAPDGQAVWYNGEDDGYVAVGDFDGDGLGEVVAVYRAEVRLQDTDGTVLWRHSLSDTTSSAGGPPTVADYDGDGEPEIGVAGRSSYTVFDADGTLLWENVTQDYSSGNTGTSVFDFEGDGQAEAVYADETRLWVFAGDDGTVRLESTDHSSSTWTEYPTVADVDGDGSAEIIVSQNGTNGGIHVFGDKDSSWLPGRRIWNQHAYSITNVNEDGTIPANPTPNWLVYNNFRSGDITANNGLKRPDLALAQAGLCDLECDTGRLMVWVHPGNEGATDHLGDITLRMYADIGGTETEVASTVVSGPLAMGWFDAAVLFDVTESDLSSWDAVVVRMESNSPDCDETNDFLRIAGPFCQ